MMGEKSEDYSCWQFVPLANSAVLFLAPAGGSNYNLPFQGIESGTGYVCIVTTADTKLGLRAGSQKRTVERKHVI
jgi:hypothetical protein